MSAPKHQYKRPAGGGDVVIYRETLISRVSFYITIFVTLALGGGIVYALSNLDTPVGRWAFWILAVVASLVLVLGICFTQLTITVTQRQLILAFGFFRLTLRRRDLVGAEATQVSLSDSSGYGIHRGRKGVRYWVTAAGPGVELTVRDPAAVKKADGNDEAQTDDRRRYIFNCRDPRRLINILDLDRE
ncbi:MAG: hypothetical protein GF403_02990 [Candidatus Coatesbacteria bacterium]|nr:hypothetical protein [Candidatus Coatesbacteria bacterium]